MVLNLAPVGCYPSFLVQLPHNSSDIDQFGCLVSYNNAVREYNNMLKQSLREVRESLSDASVIYVDTHTVLLELFQHPTSHGSNTTPSTCLIRQHCHHDYQKDTIHLNRTLFESFTISYLI